VTGYSELLITLSWDHGRRAQFSSRPDVEGTWGSPGCERPCTRPPPVVVDSGDAPARRWPARSPVLSIRFSWL